MNVFDPLAEPLRCPHGGVALLRVDGVLEWVTPCDACEPKTVAAAPAQRTVANFIAA